MSDLSSESLDLARRSARECRALRTLINGNALDLSTLNTTAKTSIVAAVNELHSSIQSITWNTLDGKPSTFTPSAHKSSHATGGTDAITPADIGAQPAGSYASASHNHDGVYQPVGSYAVLSGGNTFSGTQDFNNAARFNGAITFNIGVTFTFDTGTDTLLRDALKVPASITTGITGADAIANIISLTQAEYDAIGSKSATTLYVIT